MGQAKQKAKAREVIARLKKQEALAPERRRRWHTLNNFFVVKRIEKTDEFWDENTKKLMKPDNSRERSQEGEIKLVSKTEAEMHVGDVVVFTKYGGTDFTLYGEELVLVHRDQIYMRSDGFEDELEGQAAA